MFDLLTPLPVHLAKHILYRRLDHWQIRLFEVVIGPYLFPAFSRPGCGSQHVNVLPREPILHITFGNPIFQ